MESNSAPFFASNEFFEKSWSLAVAVTVIVGATADIAVVVVTAAVIAFLVTSVGVAVAPV